MSIDQEIVDQMYPTATTPVQAEDPVQAKQPPVVSLARDPNGDPKADALYGEPDVPPEDNAINPYILDDTTETAMYADSERLDLAEDVDLSVIYQSEEQQAVLSDNLAFIGSAVGAEQQQISSLVEAVNEFLILGDSPPEAETMADLYQAHGSSLHQKLADAQDLVSSFPDLHAWLESTGAGNSPTVIRQILKLAGTPRSQARLTKLRNK